MTTEYIVKIYDFEPNELAVETVEDCRATVLSKLSIAAVIYELIIRRGRREYLFELKVLR